MAQTRRRISILSQSLWVDVHSVGSTERQWRLRFTLMIKYCALFSSTFPSTAVYSHGLNCTDGGISSASSQNLFRRWLTAPLESHDSRELCTMWGCAEAIPPSEEGSSTWKWTFYSGGSNSSLPLSMPTLNSAAAPPWKYWSPMFKCYQSSEHLGLKKKKENQKIVLDADGSWGKEKIQWC